MGQTAKLEWISRCHVPVGMEGSGIRRIAKGNVFVFLVRIINLSLRCQSKTKAGSIGPVNLDYKMSIPSYYKALAIFLIYIFQQPAKPYCTRPRRRGWKHHQETVPHDGQVQRRWQRAAAARAARWCCGFVVLGLRRVFYEASPLTTPRSIIASAWGSCSTTQGGLSRETGIQKPPDIQLPGPQPGGCFYSAEAQTPRGPSSVVVGDQSPVFTMGAHSKHQGTRPFLYSSKLPHRRHQF